MFQTGLPTGGLPGLQLGRTGGESSASSPVRRGPNFEDSVELSPGFGDFGPPVTQPAGIPVLRKSTVPDSFHTARTEPVGGSRAWNESYRSAKPALPVRPNLTKMDRKQAWVRFLALEASTQVCIESMLSSTASMADAEFTRALLADGSKALKEGLGLEGLLLGAGDKASVNIHWDDAVEDTNRIVMVDDGRRDTLSALHDKPKIKAAVVRTSVPEVIEVQHFGLPAVEVKVSRVVGAPFLDTVCHDASIDEGPGEYTIRAFVKGGTSCTSSIGSTGGVVSGGVLCIASSQVTSVKDALYLEVYRQGGVLEACGSVMVSELQRLAVRSDALGQEPPPSLLKQLMHPSAFGRKRKDSGGSMVWAKLVATDGAPAGHVLLAAKARPADTIGGVGGVGGVGNLEFLGAATPSASCSGSGNGVGAPQIPSSAHDGGAMTPVQIRAHHGVGGVGVGHAERVGHHTLHSLTPPRTAKKQLVIANHNNTNTKNVDKANNEDDLVNFGGLLEAEDAIGHEVPIKRKHAYGNVTGGYLQVNARHVYDVLLDSALKSSGCDRNGSSLELHPQWSWLTRQFAQKHGIREEYATLAYLQWILENHRVQPNSMCFEVIAAKYVAMKTASKASSLESHELAMNTAVRHDIKALLNKTFENYFALKQNYDDDVEFLPTRGSQAATVLRSAIRLLFLVLDGDAQSCGQWMSVRFKRAANKRFYAILAAIEAQIIEREANNLPATTKVAAKGKAKVSSSADVIAYKKVGDLCRSVVEEIREDESIQATLAQSSAAHEGAALAVISENTSMEYIKGIAAHLKAVLSRYPPRKPSSAAIALVQAVGNLQDFLERHQYMDAAVRLNSFEAFCGFIQHWISSSSASLRRGVQIIDEAPGSGHNGLTWKDLHETKGDMVVPFAEVLLRELQKEMELYRPILGIWPSYASDVERACVDVLRLAITVASKHCGLVQTSKESTPSRRRKAWKWAPTDSVHSATPSSLPAHQEHVTEAMKFGTNVQQALLMNTLRRLLAVMPQIESTIQLWSEDRPETSMLGQNDDDGVNEDLSMQKPGFWTRSPGMAKSPTKSPARLAANGNKAPNLGALWAQLVKEIRTEYYAAITLTAEALSRQLSSSQATSVQHVLRKSGLQASESSMVRKSERALDQTSPTLRILSSVLDSRVFVALSRGLWDLTARHVLQYAEDLTEGASGTHGAWRGRQNASVVLSCVENFFKHEISTLLGSDLQPKDLDPPQHVQRAKALLSKGTNRVDQSFDVY